MGPRRDTPTLAEALRSVLDTRLSGVRVMLPGIVQSYDASRQRADVLPAVHDAYLDESGERQTERLPVVTEVPVIFPGASGGSLTFPLSRGDEVALVFSSSSLDRWLARGGVVDPEDDRHHTVTDAIAIPGLRHAPLPAAAVGDGAVLAGDLVQLGSCLAVDGVLLGDTFLDALSQFMTALAGAVSGIPTGGAAAGSAITTAQNAFELLASTYLSAKVAVE